ncbi:MAG: hypothetical protein AVDCRST_MAG88-4701, partial [uncultured Thermomicrobiales bacterium]
GYLQRDGECRRPVAGRRRLGRYRQALAGPDPVRLARARPVRVASAGKLREKLLCVEEVVPQARPRPGQRLRLQMLDDAADADPLVPDPVDALLAHRRGPDPPVAREQAAL